MQLWLKLLIVWLVAIALPAQGVAGVTMAHCGTGPLAAVTASGHQHQHPRQHQHQHPQADQVADDSHHHGADPADADTAASAAKAQPGTLADVSQHKCSSCAACCAGTALPSAAPHLPQVESAAAVFAEDLLTVAAFASSGPDRPPRTAPV